MMKRFPHILTFVALLAMATAAAYAQTDTAPSRPDTEPVTAFTGTIHTPDVIYSPMPKTYVIRGINVRGVDGLED